MTHKRSSQTLQVVVSNSFQLQGPHARAKEILKPQRVESEHREKYFERQMLALRFEVSCERVYTTFRELFPQKNLCSSEAQL